MGTGPHGSTVMLVVLSLAAIGAVFKGMAALAGSRAALVDLLTCIANLAAVAAAYHALRVAVTPPDTDHPYGHERYEVAAVLWITIIYSFVAGYATAQLILEPVAERIPVRAAFYAALGLAAYAAAILAARRAGLAGRAYAAFTFTELYEGLVTMTAALAGSLYNPLFDTIAAWGLLAYLLYELYEHVNQVTCILVERVPPEVVEAAKKLLESKGLRVKALRLRPLLPGKYVGDATVQLCAEKLRDAHKVVDEAERLLAAQNVILTIHYEPCK